MQTQKLDAKISDHLESLHIKLSYKIINKRNTTESEDGPESIRTIVSYTNDK